VLTQRDDDTPSVDSSTQSFDIDSRYEGPVWFTVDGISDRTIHVTLTWGEWQADVDIAPDDPHTLWTMKRSKDDSPPLTFVVSPPATVSVGLNTVPVRSTRLDSWGPRPPDTTGG